VKPVLTKLYEALSADQKKKADDLLTGMGVGGLWPRKTCNGSPLSQISGLAA
jgi:hypothetical protein